MSEPSEPSEPSAPDGSEHLGPAAVPGREASAWHWFPQTVGGVMYLLVLAGTLTGIAIVAWGSWRVGVRWVGTSLLVAAAVRLMLRGYQAGMLAVRHPLLDAAVLAGLGGALLFLAGSIPDQPL